MKLDVLFNFPFTSARKRMGIILKERSTGKIIFYMKGADFIMRDKIPEIKRAFMMDECDNLSIEGLRTLVYAFKMVTQEELDQWAVEYKKACASLVDREKLQDAAIDKMEAGVSLLGVTAVEDKLQADCMSTIQILKSAGIQFWVLTGDKVETVSSIAISTGLKSPDSVFFFLKEISTKEKLVKSLNEFLAITLKKILVVDGNSL